MDTESIRVNVHAWAWPDTLASGFLSTVIIVQSREFEKFIIDGTDGSVTSLGSYPDPSPSDPPIFLKIRNFQPKYVYQLLCNDLHDQVLAEQIANQIVAAAQRKRSQSFDSPQQPLRVGVNVKLTQKVYTVVPCNSAPLATDLDQESPEEESETCAICLENLCGSGDYCQMPNCSHCFHEICITEWCNRNHNSCPLCRKPVYEEPE